MLYILDKIDEAVSEFLTTLQIPRGHNIIFQAKWKITVEDSLSVKSYTIFYIRDTAWYALLWNRVTSL